MLLCLWLGAASIASAANDAIAIIVSHKEYKELKKDELALIYKRKKLFWSDGMKITPVNLPTNLPLRLNFSMAVLEHTPDELDKYWDDMYFHGISPPHVLSSEEAVLRFVAETRGAIGYVSFCRIDSRVDVAFVLSSTGHLVDNTANIDCAK